MNRALRFAIIASLIIAGTLAVAGYFVLLSPNTAFNGESKIILIRENTDAEVWINSDEAKSVIKNFSTFNFTSTLKKFKKIKPGRYRFKKGMNNNAIINMLRSGNQEPVSIRIDDVSDLYELSGRLGKNLQCDSNAFITAFLSDSVQQAYGLNFYTLPSVIVPNTYDFFWTMTPQSFLSKMKSIHDDFWTEEKKQQADKTGLSLVEVSTLASIVKAETAKKDEAPKIAGLYLNRLKIGMPLQSDPTAVFGRSSHVQRVYISDLSNESPYNTYRISGLPPGPINFPETTYLDAVLRAEHHAYIYMCAQPGGTGYHNFSKTLDQHNVYRKEYTDWLEKKGVR